MPSIIGLGERIEKAQDPPQTMQDQCTEEALYQYPRQTSPDGRKRIAFEYNLLALFHLTF